MRFIFMALQSPKALIHAAFSLKQTRQWSSNVRSNEMSGEVGIAMGCGATTWNEYLVAANGRGCEWGGRHAKMPLHD